MRKILTKIEYPIAIFLSIIGNFLGKLIKKNSNLCFIGSDFFVIKISEYCKNGA